MKRSNRLVLLIGIFLAIIAFVLILVTINGNKGGGSSAPPTTTTLVVAKRNIDLGATIQDNQVETKTVDITDFPPNGIKLTSLVVGQIARQPVTSGQAVTTDVLSESGGVKSVVVPTGFVAIAVQVDQVSGVGTIIKSGDYVDMVTGITGTDKVPLVVSPTIRPQGSPKPNATPAPRGFVPEVLPYNPTTVKTLIQGVQVLGTLLPPPTSSSSGAKASAGTSETTLNGQQEIVILAVKPEDAEVIKFAQIDGQISLVLRSTVDCKPVETASPGASANPSASASPAPSGSLAPVLACPPNITTGITLRRLVDDLGVLPPQVVEVIQPTPYPQVAP